MACMLNSKTFEIFNGTVTVTLGLDYIKKYEDHVGPFTNKTAEYLAVTSGYDESYSNEDIIKGIEDGIEEEKKEPPFSQLRELDGSYFCVNLA